jgi:hypothetical protein
MTPVLTVDDLEDLWSSLPENGYKYELDDGALLTAFLSSACPPEFLVIPVRVSR